MQFNPFSPEYNSYYQLVNLLETSKHIGVPLVFIYKTCDIRQYYVSDIRAEYFKGYRLDGNGNKIWKTFKLQFVQPFNYPISDFKCPSLSK